MRVASPPPNKATGRGSSLGDGTTAQPPRRAGQKITSLSSVQELTGVERPASRGSVNFSYPTGSRPESPLSQRRLTSPSPSSANPPRITAPTNQNMVYDPNSRRFIPAAQHYAIEQAILDVANKPVKKKKKVAPQQFTGTHLADGTIGGRLRGTAVDEMEDAASQPVEQPTPAPLAAPVRGAGAPVEPIATTPKRKKKKKVVVASDSESDTSYVPYTSADESDVQTNGFNTRAGTLLAKKPSIVREDREREEEEDDTPNVRGLGKLDTGARPISPTPLSRSMAGQGHGRGQASTSAAFAQDIQQTLSASQPAPVSPTIPAVGGLAAKESVRVQSVSPARTTHFATTPDSLLVKHQPPPRSISPRKSALKRSNSPRGPSPVDEVGHGVDSSEASNGSAAPADELPLPRKKAVRVSFDETSVAVGQAATPVVTDSPVQQSPHQAKKPWLSIGRSKKKDIPVSEDDDEVMKPRPALPSFGSVRKNRSEPVEERPLVKPSEPVDSTPPSLPSPPLFTAPTGELIEFPLGQSNDHKIGAILSQDASSKNAANISKSREPLPPQVTSVEGSGYSSDTDSSVSDQKSPALPIESKVAEEIKAVETEIDPSTINRESQTPTPTGLRSNGEVPEIAVLQATPTLEHADNREWPDMEHMPGGWGASSASDSGSAVDETDIPVEQPIEHTHTDTTPATIGIAEPPPTEHQPGSPLLGDIAAENAHTIPAILEEIEESDTSVYSDAAEDLTDGEGEGFQSLDAVVDSPIVPSAIPGLAITTPPESPTARTAKEKVDKKSQLSRKTSEPDLDEGWEKAQEYWKGLSEDKKLQLEQEARDEAEVAEDSDSTIEAKPAPKPKKKKKVVVQSAAAEVPIIRQPVANNRTYMIQPGSKAGPGGHPTAMRSSMRVEPVSTAQDTTIRKSMRGPGSMRGSLRGDQPAEPRGSKKTRPVSLPAPKAEAAAANKHIRNLSAASAAAAQGAALRDMAPKPPLRRKSSGDSDSSFKRVRRSTEVPSMRRSMRGSVNERQQSPIQSSRFSLRSLSPTGSGYRKPFSSSAATSGSPTHMRNSLRSSVGAAPSLRGSKPEKTSRLGFGRSSSSKPTPKPIRQRSSRFADSSDEEDTRPAFRSRFIDSDSSDDETPVSRSGGFNAGTMRANVPVRGIPKRAGAEDGDSSDLPDSDDEKKSPKLAPGLKLSKNRQNGTAAPVLSRNSGSLRRSGSGRDTMASPMTMTTISAARPNQTRRGSFMSILRRKKDPSSKVRKAEIESAARRDTPLERSKSDLAAVKRQESYSSATGRPSTPKLQKKPPGWPLVSNSSPKILGGEDGRPSTADAGDGVVGGEAVNGVNGVNGVMNGDRPDLGMRRFTATGLGEVDLSGVGKGRKKKKFGALRRMFRLDD